MSETQRAILQITTAPQYWNGRSLKTIVSVLALVAAMFASGCASTKFAEARNNGAKVDIGKGGLEAGDYLTWSGGKDTDGYASGKGTVTFAKANGVKYHESNCSYTAGKANGDFVERYYVYSSGGRAIYDGKLTQEIRGRYSNGVPVGKHVIRYVPQRASGNVSMTMPYNSKGKLHGESFRVYSDGKRSVSQWNNGEPGEYIVYNPDGSVARSSRSSSSTSGSGASDNLLVGGILALGGMAGDDAGVAASGLSIMAGDGPTALGGLSGTTSGHSNDLKLARESSRPSANYNSGAQLHWGYSAGNSRYAATADGKGKPAVYGIDQIWKSWGDHPNAEYATEEEARRAAQAEWRPSANTYGINRIPR